MSLFNDFNALDMENQSWLDAISEGDLRDGDLVFPHYNNSPKAGHVMTSCTGVDNDGNPFDVLTTHGGVIEKPIHIPFVGDFKTYVHQEWGDTRFGADKLGLFGVGNTGTWGASYYRYRRINFGMIFQQYGIPKY